MIVTATLLQACEVKPPFDWLSTYMLQQLKELGRELLLPPGEKRAAVSCSLSKLMANTFNSTSLKWFTCFYQFWSNY